MKDFVYVFKDDICYDLINLRNRLDVILRINDEEGFSDVDSLPIFPALFRLYSHLWMKNTFGLFKKKYIHYEEGKKFVC